MIVLFGATSGPLFEMKRQARGNVGVILSPEQYTKPADYVYAADNSCYSHRNEPDWWELVGEANWLKMLARIATFAPPPIFVVLPDVVGDWNRTLERAWRYLPVVEEYGLPPAIALQDGCEGEVQYREVEKLGLGVLFVGGTTAWKLRNIPILRKRFRREWLHVGRVNGCRRLQYCLDCRVDSVDGTGWNKFPSELPKLYRILDGKHPQTRMTEFCRL